MDEKLQKAYEKALQVHLPKEDVTGVMIGLKFKNGQWTDEQCISIHIKKKKPLEELDKKDVIAKTILGIKTDVIEANPALMIDNRLKQDIASPGLSISTEGTTSTGSLGCLVYKNGAPHFLTNFHVTVPTHGRPISDYVKQPGVADRGVDEYDRIGTIANYKVDTRGDFALIAADSTLRLFGGVPFNTSVILTTARKPLINEIVEKTGRTTGDTVGKVVGFGAFGTDYSEWGLGTIYIVGFAIAPLEDPNELIADHGDSGSLGWIKDGTDAVGVLTAGSWSPTIAYFSYLTNALEDWGLSITDDKAIWKPDDSIVSNFFALGWISPDEEKTHEFTLTFNEDYKNVFLYTDPQYVDLTNQGILWAKLSTEDEYRPVGIFSNTPSCNLGNMVKNATVTIQVKVVLTLDLIGEQNIPVYISYGNSISPSGLKDWGNVWQAEDFDVWGWASSDAEFLSLQLGEAS